MPQKSENRTDQLPDHVIKGNLVESIVASLHTEPGILTATKVKMKSLSNPKRRREIDVLVSTELLGRIMYLAFECKNYGQRIGVPKIDEFRGKLEDVGIPIQHGIFVTSVHGFTQDAHDRASSLGIKLMVLEGLSDDRLTSEVRQAFQSLIYTLAVIKSITITNETAIADPSELLFLRDQKGNYCGSVLDLIWAKWRDGQIPQDLGEHNVLVDIPTGWRWVINGAPTVSTAKAVVDVSAYVISIPGTAEQHALRDAITGGIDRGRTSMSFANSETRFQATRAGTEEELQALVRSATLPNLVIGRIPLPRIIYKCFWPPSERVLLSLSQLTEDLISNGTWSPGCLESLTFGELEGSDLNAVWEPIWPGHPAANSSRWPFNTNPRRRKTPITPKKGRSKQRR